MQDRKQVMYQFELQLGKIGGLEIEQRLTNYRYILHDAIHNCQRTAIVLSTSWQYYEVWLHRTRKGIDLLIVARHNAVVPCTVLELETGKEYRPGSVPAIEREGRKQPNHEEANLFVSKLLIGLSGAYDELREMPLRTQARYLQRRDAMLSAKVGRPWAS